MYYNSKVQCIDMARGKRCCIAAVLREQLRVRTWNTSEIDSECALCIRPHVEVQLSGLGAATGMFQGKIPDPRHPPGTSGGS